MPRQKPYAHYLGPPFLPRRAAARAWRIATGHLPVLLVGEQGTGRRRVARALHETARPNDPFVVIRAPSGPADLQGRLAAVSREVRQATAYVENVEELDPAGQECLLAMFDEGMERRGSESLAVWFILGASADLREVVERGQFLPELWHRASTLMLELPPLRARRDEIPDLVQALTDEVASLLPLVRVRYSQRALDELCAYAWPGNVHELEAVIRRTVVMQRKETIDAGDLLFHPSDGPSGAAETAATAARPAPLPGELEYLLIQLAHELKNPMVTIKTFAKHLDDLLDDAEARMSFSLLATDAIARMDGLLDNLLEFSRLPAPAPGVIDVAPLVHEALGAVKNDLAAKQVELRVQISGSQVRADPRHIRYALRNLACTMATEVPARSWLSVDLGPGRGLRLALPAAGGLTQRLKDLAGGRLEAAIPLGFVLARSVVVTNGGQLRVEDAEGRTDITVTLPEAV